MWQRSPLCFWCQRATVLEIPKKGPVPKNLATLDHLRPRHDPTRREVNPGDDKRIVLACNECNNDRDRGERLLKGKEWIWSQSGNALPLHLKTDDVVLAAYRTVLRLVDKAKGHPTEERKVRKRLEYIEADLKRRNYDLDMLQLPQQTARSA